MGMVTAASPTPAHPLPLQQHGGNWLLNVPHNTPSVDQLLALLALKTDQCSYEATCLCLERLSHVPGLGFPPQCQCSGQSWAEGPGPPGRLQPAREGAGLDPCSRTAPRGCRHTHLRPHFIA